MQFTKKEWDSVQFFSMRKKAGLVKIHIFPTFPSQRSATAVRPRLFCAGDGSSASLDVIHYFRSALCLISVGGLGIKDLNALGMHKVWLLYPDTSRYTWYTGRWSYTCTLVPSIWNSDATVPDAAEELWLCEDIELFGTGSEKAVGNILGWGVSKQSGWAQVASLLRNALCLGWAFFPHPESSRGETNGSPEFSILQSFHQPCREIELEVWVHCYFWYFWHLRQDVEPSRHTAMLLSVSKVRDTQIHTRC